MSEMTDLESMFAGVEVPGQTSQKVQEPAQKRRQGFCRNESACGMRGPSRRDACQMHDDNRKHDRNLEAAQKRHSHGSRENPHPALRHEGVFRTVRHAEEYLQ